jgi:hypothetical protein
MMIRGWQAVGLSTARDAWIRSCVFDSFIQAVRLDTSSAVTVADNRVWHVSTVLLLDFYLKCFFYI